MAAGLAFALFAASSTRYAAIYSSFAILILFMLWLYLSWLILLFGAAVSFYVQHPEHLVARAGEPRLSNRMRERLALVIMSRIARRHLDGAAPLSADELAQTLRMPMRAVDVVLDSLRERGILACTGDDPPGWLPLRDLESASAKDLLDAVRGAGEDRYLSIEALPVPEPVERLLRRSDEALASALSGVTLKDLAANPDQRAEDAASRAERRASGAGSASQSTASSAFFTVRPRSVSPSMTRRRVKNSVSGSSRRSASER